MKLLRASACNFGSYKQLTFSFTNRGLLSISGQTGSGKSTIQDIACWALFGVTAKNGNADDVRPWYSKDDTSVCLEVEIDYQTTVQVTRIRGKTKDLYWQIVNKDQGVVSTPIRGKDTQDSQKLLENLLGVSSTLYLTSAVFNEFSRTGNFFTNSAKDRRKLLETISDLSLPTKVLEGAGNDQKKTKKDLEKKQSITSNFSGRLEQLRNTLRDVERREEVWSKTVKDKISKIQASASSFEQDKQIALDDYVSKSEIYQKTLKRKVEILNEYLETSRSILDTTTDSCEKCKQPNPEHNHHLREYDKTKIQLDLLLSAEDPYRKEITKLQQSVNVYSLQLEQAKLESNPFVSQKDGIICDIELISKELEAEIYYIDTLKARINRVDQLQDLAAQLKGVLVQKAISEIETTTNDYIQNYFDGEIRIQLLSTNSDDIDINILKNGHECSYSQLSRGQRSMLKLCFSVCVMEAAANNAGVQFDTLFFDEVLDGLDANLKVKALSLFQELEQRHETVMIVDHSTDLQSHFHDKLEVTLEGDCSKIVSI